jgi:hypothetical protein
MIMVEELRDKEYSNIIYPVDGVETDGKTSIKPITSVISIGSEEQHTMKLVCRNRQ